MHTKHDGGTDGTIGLGVLLLMTVAFVASETHSGPQIAISPELPRPSANSQILIDQARPPRDVAIGGAIRELTVLPTGIESRLDLGWASDDALIEAYWPTRPSRPSGQSGF